MMVNKEKYQSYIMDFSQINVVFIPYFFFKYITIVHSVIIISLLLNNPLYLTMVKTHTLTNNLIDLLNL